MNAQQNSAKPVSACSRRKGGQPGNRNALKSGRHTAALRAHRAALRERMRDLERRVEYAIAVVEFTQIENKTLFPLPRWGRGRDKFWICAPANRVESSVGAASLDAAAAFLFLDVR